MFIQLGDRLVNINHIKQITKVSNSDSKIELSCGADFIYGKTINELYALIYPRTMDNHLDNIYLTLEDIHEKNTQIRDQLIDISSAIREGHPVDPVV